MITVAITQVAANKLKIKTDAKCDLGSSHCYPTLIDGSMFDWTDGSPALAMIAHFVPLCDVVHHEQPKNREIFGACRRARCLNWEKNFNLNVKFGRRWMVV